MNGSKEVAQDVVVRRRTASRPQRGLEAVEARADSSRAFASEDRGFMPPSNGIPAAARAGELVGISATMPDVVTRARMSIALQQNVGNARAGAMMAGTATQAAPARPTLAPSGAPPVVSPRLAAVPLSLPARSPTSGPEETAEIKPAASDLLMKKSEMVRGTRGKQPGPEEAPKAASTVTDVHTLMRAGTHTPVHHRVLPKTGPEAPGGAEAPEVSAIAPKKPSGRAVVLKMKEPPADMSAASHKRIAAAGVAASHAASSTASLPPAAAHVDQAREAVTPPSAESAAKAEADLVAALGDRPKPSPEVEELCKKIYAIVTSKTPQDEPSLIATDPEAMARGAGDQLKGNVQGDVQKVGQSYSAIDQKPAGDPGQPGKPLEDPGAAAPTAPIDADKATPDPIPAEHASLDADVADTKAKAQQAGMDSAAAKCVQTGPVAEARGAQGELEQTAKEDPAKVIAQQQATLAKAGADMSTLQKSALDALNAARHSTVSGTTGQQHKMVGSEESMRAKASGEAQAIFTDTQTKVNALLQPIQQNATNKWDAGVAIASTKFKQAQKKIEDWLKQRHGGAWGTVVSVWDEFVGLPSWVTDNINAAEQAFGNEICDLARQISTDVNGIIMACEALIADARKKIAAVFSSLPASLQSWAADQQAKFATQLDGLSQHTHEVQSNFTRDLVKKATQAFQDARDQLHALREKAKGLVGRVLYAIDRFEKDPAKFIIEGLLELLGIPPSAFWAVVAKIQKAVKDIAADPLKFASNLLKAVGQGFSQFFDNVLSHLLHGFIDWLTGGLAAAGVTLPKDASLKSIITFVLQLMGITWTRIRKLLAKHIGEENVALIEKAYSIVATLIALGPEGIFEMIKEKLNPKTILDQIIKAAVDYMEKAVIKAVAARIIMLFNPVGAIVEALEAIYRVLKWIFVNAARIFKLVETIVNGIADIIAGSIGGLANAVESALAQLIPPVIDFLADYLGFGDLPEKIKVTIIGFQAWVESVLDQVIGWLVEKGKALLAAVGLGGGDKEKKGPKDELRSKVHAELTNRLKGAIDEPEQLDAIITPIWEKYQPEGLTSIGVTQPVEKSAHFVIEVGASPAEKEGEFDATPTLDVSDLDLRKAQTVLLARVNGKAFPTANPIYNEPRGLHAEEVLLKQLEGEWPDPNGAPSAASTFFSQAGPNVLEIKITRSPCMISPHNCADKLAKFSARPGLRLALEMLSFYSGFQYKAAPSSAEGLLQLLKLSPKVELKIWNVLKELEKFGIEKQDLSDETLGKIESRLDKLQAKLDLMKKVKKP